MLHLLYILAFTILAFIAVGNLIRNLLTLSNESQRRYPPTHPSHLRTSPYSYPSVPHPELLDETGRPINEPLLVVRSIDVEDAREQLEALYKNPPEGTSH